jgi:hypothetical protein
MLSTPFFVRWTPKGGESGHSGSLFSFLGLGHLSAAMPEAATQAIHPSEQAL